MKAKRQCMVMIAAFMLVAFRSAWGGQIVTDDARTWARRAAEPGRSPQMTVANTAAVFPFANRTQQPEFNGLRKGIAALLVTDLSKLKGLSVIERTRLQALAEELNLREGRFGADDSMPPVGRCLGAQWLVGGTIERRGDGLQLEVGVLELPASRTIGRAEAEGAREDLLRMEKDLVFKIAGLLGIVPTPEEEMALRRPITTSGRAFLDFSACLDLSDRKEFREAAKWCESALKADPNFDLARSAVNELRSLGSAGGAGKSARFINSLRERTSLSNQLTPHDSMKRVITPQTTSIIEQSSPPLRQPADVPSEPTPVGPSPAPLPP